jgi:hypothetical protein
MGCDRLEKGIGCRAAQKALDPSVAKIDEEFPAKY